MSKYLGRVITNQAPAGYSVYFNGTNSDAVEIANNAAFDFGTGDVTVEAWVNLASTSAIQNLIDCGPSSGSGFTSWTLDITASGFIRFGSYVSGTYQNIEATNNALVANQWYHIAFTRTSGTNRLFVNGALCTTTGGTFTQAINSGGNTVLIGRGKYSGFTRPSTGNFSNVRIVKGVAVYTAAFSPPTQLLNVTGTSLLTCNSPAFVDQSSNAFTVTVLAAPSISTFTPFRAYVPYNPALGASTPGVWTLDEAMQAAATRQWNMYDPSFQNTTLLLHGNGTNAAQNNTFLDSSTNNFTITRNGNTTQGSFSPFSNQVGAWSNYFDGNGDFLSFTNNANTNLGTGDFTVEAWVYLTAGNNFQMLFAPGPSTSGSLINYFSLAWGASTDVFGLTASNGVQSFSGTATTPINRWAHVAFVRISGTLYFYINGVAAGSGAFASAWGASTGTATIGYSASYPGQYYLNGYLSNFRVIKGAGIYTGNFTPPTAPLTAITNTQLLTCQSNRFIDNSANAFELTANGNVSIQPFSPFYPTAAYTPATIGGSGYFDGTGDYLSNAANTIIPNTGDFTFETWVYPTQVSTLQYLISTTSTNTGNKFHLYINASAFVGVQTGGSFRDSSTTKVVANAWNHVACTRTGSTYALFVNGVLQTISGSGTMASTLDVAPTQIGSRDAGTSPITGYLSGTRVSNSVLYTVTFTPPTAPFATGTNLLLNFTNAGIVDSAAKNVLETVGNAQISTTQSKFGGSSMYFDGTGDWLTSPYVVLQNFGTGDFTVEMWAYFSSLSANVGLFAKTYNTDANTWQGMHVFINTSGTINYETNDTLSNGTTGARISSSINVTTGTWYHIAFVRFGGTTKIYLNGVSVGSGSNAGSADNTYGFVVGNARGGASPAWSMNGYIDDFRVTKGVARYTAAFTPQTSQWQDR